MSEILQTSEDATFLYLLRSLSQMHSNVSEKLVKRGENFEEKMLKNGKHGQFWLEKLSDSQNLPGKGQETISVKQRLFNVSTEKNVFFDDSGFSDSARQGKWWKLRDSMMWIGLFDSAVLINCFDAKFWFWFWCWIFFIIVFQFNRFLYWFSKWV